MDAQMPARETGTIRPHEGVFWAHRSGSLGAPSGPWERRRIRGIPAGKRHFDRGPGPDRRPGAQARRACHG
jgi:hypothetical protein